MTLDELREITHTVIEASRFLEDMKRINGASADRVIGLVQEIDRDNNTRILVDFLDGVKARAFEELQKLLNDRVVKLREAGIKLPPEFIHPHELKV